MLIVFGMPSTIHRSLLRSSLQTAATAILLVTKTVLSTMQVLTFVIMTDLQRFLHHVAVSDNLLFVFVQT